MKSGLTFIQTNTAGTIAATLGFFNKKLPCISDIPESVEFANNLTRIKISTSKIGLQQVNPPHYPLKKNGKLNVPSFSIHMWSKYTPGYNLPIKRLSRPSAVKGSKEAAILPDRSSISRD
ncbi:MAG: hypothetical protein IPK61_06500 [Saprospiraceae bacterium]|nr:hypothetical protein [Saprospiraceae bacterium]